MAGPATALAVVIVVYMIQGGDDFTDRNTLPNNWDVAFGIALIVLVLEASAILFIPLWVWVARKTDKRRAFIWGSLSWVVVLAGLMLVGPRQVVPVYVLAALGGSGLATQTCGALDTSTVGFRTVTCTAADHAGNTSQQTIAYLKRMRDEHPPV